MNRRLVLLGIICCVIGVCIGLISPNSMTVLAAPWTPTPAANGSGGTNCVIPKSGPWPACATAGGGSSSPASGNCVIPKTGPWPACATQNAGGSAAAGTPIPPSQTPQATAAWQPTPVFVAPSDVKRPTYEIGRLAQLGEDTRVIVGGRVVSAESFSKGYKFNINDGTGTVVMLVWATVYDAMPQKSVLNIGSELVVQGVIDRFEGRTQVVPLFGEAIQITQPAGITGRSVTVRELGRYVDQRVLVEGRVQRIENTEYGTEIVINDGTGDAELFLWSNNYVRLPQRYLLKENVHIRAAGKVSEFRGRFTITPFLPYDVEVRR